MGKGKSRNHCRPNGGGGGRATTSSGAIGRKTTLKTRLARVRKERDKAAAAAKEPLKPPPNTSSTLVNNSRLTSSANSQRTVPAHPDNQTTILHGHLVRRSSPTTTAASDQNHNNNEATDGPLGTSTAVSESTKVTGRPQPSVQPMEASNVPQTESDPKTAASLQPSQVNNNERRSSLGHFQNQNSSPDTLNGLEGDDEPPDEALLCPPINTGSKGPRQLLSAIRDGTPEVRDLLLNECNLIFECAACSNMFRSLPNFLAHKRLYCMRHACREMALFDDRRYRYETLERNRAAIAEAERPLHEEEARRRSHVPGTLACSSPQLKDATRGRQQRPLTETERLAKRARLDQLFEKVAAERSSNAAPPPSTSFQVIPLEATEKAVHLKPGHDLNPELPPDLKPVIEQTHTLHISENPAANSKTTGRPSKRKAAFPPRGHVPNGDIHSDLEDQESQSEHDGSRQGGGGGGDSPHTSNDSTESHWSCPYCNQCADSTRRELGIHLATKHGGGDVIFPCLECPKSFNRLFNTIRHMCSTHGVAATLEEKERLKVQIGDLSFASLSAVHEKILQKRPVPPVPARVTLKIKRDPYAVTSALTRSAASISSNKAVPTNEVSSHPESQPLSIGENIKLRPRIPSGSSVASSVASASEVTTPTKATSPSTRHRASTHRCNCGRSFSKASSLASHEQRCLKERRKHSRSRGPREGGGGSGHCNGGRLPPLILPPIPEINFHSPSKSPAKKSKPSTIKTEADDNNNPNELGSPSRSLKVRTTGGANSPISSRRPPPKDYIARSPLLRLQVSPVRGAHGTFTNNPSTPSTPSPSTSSSLSLSSPQSSRQQRTVIMTDSTTNSVTNSGQDSESESPDASKTPYHHKIIDKQRLCMSGTTLERIRSVINLVDLRCELCPNVLFMNAHKLINHSVTHFGCSVYKCKECLFQCTTVSFMESHVTRAHSVTVPILRRSFYVELEKARSPESSAAADILLPSLKSQNGAGASVRFVGTDVGHDPDHNNEEKAHNHNKDLEEEGADDGDQDDGPRPEVHTRHHHNRKSPAHVHSSSHNSSSSAAAADEMMTITNSSPGSLKISLTRVSSRAGQASPHWSTSSPGSAPRSGISDESNEEEEEDRDQEEQEQEQEDDEAEGVEADVETPSNEDSQDHSTKQDDEEEDAKYGHEEDSLGDTHQGTVANGDHDDEEEIQESDNEHEQTLDDDLEIATERPQNGCIDEEEVLNEDLDEEEEIQEENTLEYEDQDQDLDSQQTPDEDGQDKKEEMTGEELTNDSQLDDDLEEGELEEEGEDGIEVLESSSSNNYRPRQSAAAAAAAAAAVHLKIHLKANPRARGGYERID